MTPYHEAAESRILAATGIAQYPPGLRMLTQIFGEPGAALSVATGIKDAVRNAVPFYWTTALATAIDPVREPGTGWEDAPICDSGWFYFERPIPIGRDRRLVKAVFFYSPTGDAQGTAMPFPVGDHEPWMELCDDARAWLFTAFMWLRTRVFTESVPIERHALKRIAKAGSDTTSVRVVVLRKAEPNEPSGSTREMHCHYRVREFNRRLQSGKVVKVRSHLRGPRDKPFKAPSDVIFAVTR